MTVNQNSLIQVLHFCPLPSFSGLEQYALKLAVEQRALGLMVGFVTLRGSELEAEATQVGVPVFSVGFNYLKSVIGAAGEYEQILLSLADLKVIHLHTSQDIDRIGLALLRARFHGLKVKPKIIQQNHVWISHSKRDPIHWLTHRGLDEIWCSSEPARRDVERFLPVPKEKIKVVRYGRDLSILNSFLPREAARLELGLPPDAVIIGAIARIDRAKGIWELIEASVELMTQSNQFYLMIIGPPTLTDPVAVEFSKRVDALVQSLPAEIRERIRLPGGIPNAGRLLKAFDLYAQVAYKETFSLALLDAQLAELPVIGTNSGGTPEVVRENETGWLAKPEDTGSLRETIARALHEKSHWTAFGIKARARVEKEFDIREIVPEIIRRYELNQDLK